MNKPFALTVDVGTSSLKAVLYNAAGEVMDIATSRYEYLSPRAEWAEANPEDWWTALVETVEQLREIHTNFYEIQALALTGQMHTAVLLDNRLEPLAPTILWLDRRAVQETAELQQRLHMPAYQLNSTYTLPKLLWLVRNMPEVIARTRWLLWPKDYLRFRLTGHILTDITEAGGAALLDWETLTWAEERLSQIGISPDILPPLCRPEDDAGTLLPEVANVLGLSSGIKVIVGAGDVLALISSAPPLPGRVTCCLGSSSMVYYPLAEEQDISDPLGRLYVYPLLPYRLLGGVSSTTGASLQWAWRTLFPQDVPFEDAVKKALQSPPGARQLIFLPFLSGERSPYWSDDLRGAFYGLSLSHTIGDMLRSVMEGVAFSLRYLLAIYNELGIKIDEIALAGGGVNTPGWPQMIADVCQLPVSVFCGEDTVTRALYAYICQALEGTSDAFVPALLRTFGSANMVLPKSDLKMVYDPLFERYHKLSDFLYQLFSEV